MILHHHLGIFNVCLSPYEIKWNLEEGKGGEGGEGRGGITTLLLHHGSTSHLCLDIYVSLPSFSISHHLHVMHP
jgi:hypothetical protein